MPARNRFPVVSGSRPALGSANVIVQRGRIQVPGASPVVAHGRTNGRGLQTVAYQCVQDDVGMLSIELGESDPLSRSGLEHLVLEGGDFPQMLRVSEAQTDAAAMIGEMSAGTDAPSPIAATTGKHKIGCLLPTVSQQLHRERCEIAARIFHHLEEIGAGFLHCDAIDFAHLLGGHGRDFQSGSGESNAGAGECHGSTILNACPSGSRTTKPSRKPNSVSLTVTGSGEMKRAWPLRSA